MDRALGNPLGNPLGLARGATSEPRTVVTIQANGTFEIPARFNFAVLHWFGAGQAGSTYFGGAGGGYAGTKPIKLAGFASRVLTVSGNFSCSGLGYVLSSVYQDDRNVGVGGDYNYKGGRGGQGGGTLFGNGYGAGGGAAGPSGDGADGAGWILNGTTYQWEAVPAGRGASGGGGVGINLGGFPSSAGGGGGGGVGGGGVGGGGGGGGSTPYLPSQGMGSSPFYTPLAEGMNAPSGTGGAGGIGGGGGGAGSSAGGPGGQFLLVVELW